MAGNYLKGLKGSQLPQSNLTEKLVKIIREGHARKEAEKRRLDAEWSAAAIAKRFGVGKTTVEKVLTYATWRHVG